MLNLQMRTTIALWRMEYAALRKTTPELPVPLRDRDPVTSEEAFLKFLNLNRRSRRLMRRILRIAERPLTYDRKITIADLFLVQRNLLEAQTTCLNLMIVEAIGLYLKGAPVVYVMKFMVAEAILDIHNAMRAVQWDLDGREPPIVDENPRVEHLYG